jgi:hypothetical protein
MEQQQNSDPLTRYPFLKDAALSDDLKKFLIEKSVQSDLTKWANQFEVRKWRWSTPLAIALTGVITIGANFAADYWKAQQKQTIEAQSSDSEAKRKATAAEREFEYRIVERELSQDKPEKDRARVLLFLVRSGVLNGLNAGELRQMAQDALDDKGTVGVPSLGVARQDLATFCKTDPRTGAANSTELSDEEWLASNLIEVSIPQLRKFIGDGKVRFNRNAAKALQDAFAEVENRGLLDLVMSWDGAFVLRQVRAGGRPSVHACGTAFDINARWNAFGVVPAAQGSTGSVIELVPIFEKHGFVWGGKAPRFQNREGMHFEFAVTTNNPQ